MGCDIHMFVEMKAKKIGKWVLYSQPDTDRDYDLFAKMANVRNGGEVEPIAEPRGLPEDISDSVKIVHDYDGPDAHSESYLTYPEIIRLGNWYGEKYPELTFGFANQFGFFFGNGFEDWAGQQDPPDIEDVRFVFWFDN